MCRQLFFLSLAASVCGRLSGSLQGPTGHFQGSFLGLVPANKASGVDKDAALDPAELRQGVVTNAAPLLEKGQPGTGRQKGKLAHRWSLCGQRFSSC